MVPMSPNALITMTCPLLNVPKKTFFFSILFGEFQRKLNNFISNMFVFLNLGMAPYTFITVQTGSFLSQLNSWDDLFTGRTLLTLALMASVVGCAGFIIARVRRQIPQTVMP
jgi:uncharacterized membrane protein YdjX (TVP38/TMEM64 family)